MILLHPSNLLFSLTLLSSIALVLSAKSWLMAWAALEINLMAIVPLMLKKNNKYQTESAMKYFLIQATSSILVMISLMNIKTQTSFSLFLFTSSMMLKIAAAPLHQWLPSLVCGLAWPLIFIVLAPQKMGPIFFLYSNSEPLANKKLIMLFLVTSALLGAIGGLTQTNLKKIFVYSSISHMSWMLAGVTMNSLIWFTYFIVYVSILLPLIYTMNKKKLLTLSQFLKKKMTTSKLMLSLNFISLGGLPPFSGFLAKMMMLVSLTQKDLVILVFPMLTGSLVSLFFYLRATFTNIYQAKKEKSPKNNKTSDKKMFFFNLVGLLSGFLLFL